MKFLQLNFVQIFSILSKKKKKIFENLNEWSYNFLSRKYNFDPPSSKNMKIQFNASDIILKRVKSIPCQDKSSAR